MRRATANDVGHRCADGAPPGRAGADEDAREEDPDERARPVHLGARRIDLRHEPTQARCPRQSARGTDGHQRHGRARSIRHGRHSCRCGRRRRRTARAMTQTQNKPYERDQIEPSQTNRAATRPTPLTMAHQPHHAGSAPLWRRIKPAAMPVVRARRLHESWESRRWMSSCAASRSSSWCQFWQNRRPTECLFYVLPDRICRTNRAGAWMRYESVRSSDSSLQSVLSSSRRPTTLSLQSVPK